MAKATIYDVSARAGVSIATVSRVLNSPDQVQPQTRERVLRAIDELDFQPKFEALVRARKRLGRLGVLTPFFTSASFVDRLTGVRAALTGQPYETVIYDVTSAAQRDGYLAMLAVTQAVDGLLVIGLALDERAARRLVKHHLPTVQIVPAGQPFIDPDLSCVVHDDALGGRLAAEYLLARGHRRLGFVGDTDIPDFTGISRDQKLDSFRQTLALAGVPLPNAYIGLAPFDRDLARQQAHRLLALPEPPTAIFAGSDIQALGVITAARERGLTVPGDLAVMGFDDIEIAEFIGLTTIRQELKDSGHRAVELLLAQVNEPAGPGRRVEMPFTLMQRATA